MNWEAIGAIGEIIGAAAVVGTLMYLAIQMNQSNRLAKRAAVQAVLEGRIEFNRFVSASAEISHLWWTGLDNPDELNQAEWNRFLHVFGTLARHYEAIYIDQLGGLLPTGVQESQRSNMKRWFSRPGAMRFFEFLGDDFDPGFMTYAGIDHRTLDQADYVK